MKMIYNSILGLLVCNGKTVKLKNPSAPFSQKRLTDFLTLARYVDIQVTGTIQSFRDALENKKYIVYRNRDEVTVHHLWLTTPPRIAMITAVGIADEQVVDDRIIVHFRIALSTTYARIVHGAFIFTSILIGLSIEYQDSLTDRIILLSSLIFVLLGYGQLLRLLLAQSTALSIWIKSVSSGARS